MNDKESENIYIDFCSYIQPIISGCVGFIKTDGYFAHVPGAILAMSSDETVFAMIKIPVIYNIYITGIIGRFMQLKTPEDQVKLFDNLYFTGWNVKYNNLKNYYAKYTSIDNSKRIFIETNCYNIPRFQETVSSTTIGNVQVSNGRNLFIVPVSKSITNLNKADSIQLDIFDTFDKCIKTVRYTMYKKKFKLNVEIFMNILSI